MVYFILSKTDSNTNLIFFPYLQLILVRFSSKLIGFLATNYRCPTCRSSNCTPSCNQTKSIDSKILMCKFSNPQDVELNMSSTRKQTSELKSEKADFSKKCEFFFLTRGIFFREFELFFSQKTRVRKSLSQLISSFL